MLDIKKKLKKMSLLGGVFFAFLLVSLHFALVQPAYATTGINGNINFQGKLTNPDGTNVTDGTGYELTFKLYNVSSAGSAVWTEVQTGVTVSSGVFQVALGSITSLSTVDFNNAAIYLGIQVTKNAVGGATTDAEMTPRLQFAAVPYAFNAQKVNGLTVTNSTGTLTIPNGTTIAFSGANNTTFTTSGTTTVTLPTTGTLLTNTAAANQTITTTQTTGTGLAITDSTTQTAALVGQSINLSGTGAFDQTGLQFNLSGATGTNLNDIVGSGSTWKMSKLGVLTSAGLTSSGTITFSALNTAGGIGYFNGSGALLASAAGVGGQCLLSGGAGSPTWGSCAASAAGPFQVLTGAILPFNSTEDLLIGGQASTSAKFAFLNVNNGTPTASVSTGVAGTSVYLAADGSLSTQNRMSLTLGNSASHNTTGNVLVNPNGVGNFGIGITNPAMPFHLVGQAPTGNDSAIGKITGQLVDGASYQNALYISPEAAPGVASSQQYAAIKTVMNAFQATNLTNAGIVGMDLATYNTGTGTLGYEYAGKFINNNASTGTVTNAFGAIIKAATNTGGGVVSNNTGLAIEDQTVSANNTDLLIGTSTQPTGNYGIYNSSTKQNYIAGNFGVGAVIPTSLFSVGATSQFQINTSGQIVAAAGLTSSGTITFSGLNTAGGIGYFNGSGTLLTSVAGVGGQCLVSGGSGAPTWTTCGTGGSSPFTSIGGMIVPNNNTQDFLIGGQSTASADFAFLNVNSGTPTASISAQANGAFYFTATGSAQTTKRNTMVFGGGTSGNIQFNNLLNTPFALFDTVNSRFGLGTTAPSAKLDIQDASIGSGNGIAGTFNGLTSGYGLAMSSNSTLLTTGGLASFDWSPGLATTATGDLLSLNVGANGTIGNILNIKNAGSSIFSVSQAQLTSNIPAAFTAPGDVLFAYDMQFTNPTASTIKSAAPLIIQSGETFNSDDLTLRSFNSGHVVLDASGVIVTGLTTQGGIPYTSDTAGSLSQTAAGLAGQCLVSGGTATPTWGSCTTGVNQTFQVVNGAIVPFNATQDFLVGGQASTSADFAFLNTTLGTPTASISAGTTGNNTFLTGAGLLATTNEQSLQIGNATTGNIVMNGGSRVGIGTALPLATFDVRAILGTAPTASISGSTAMAGLVVDQSGIGDIFTASVSGASKFTIANNGNVKITNTLTSLNGALNLQATSSVLGSQQINFLDSSGVAKARIDLNSPYGTGVDGAVSFASGTNNINTTSLSGIGGRTFADGIAYRVIAPVQGATSVTRFSGADTLSNGIAVGDELLIIDLQGSTAANDASDVGKYQFIRVAAVSASTITFVGPINVNLTSQTAANQKVVVQRVPNYTNVTLTGTGVITASAYDGLATTPTGNAGYLTGIVAFRANGTVSLASGTSINTNAKGYRGGAGGVAGANGGTSGETFDTQTLTVGSGTGRGGSGATVPTAGFGGGASGDNAIASPATGGQFRGGGGGGGSSGSTATGTVGAGGGAGGSYGTGGGGGGGAASTTSAAGGASGALPGGGGGAGTTTGGAGGSNAAGSNGTGVIGVGGAIGSAVTNASGGGGGAAAATGAGGGGGAGSLYGAANLSTLLPGSGGGGGGGTANTVNTAGGAGGAGGGIIFISADTVTLTSTGTISSVGGAGGSGTTNSGAGGSGAGGSIMIQGRALTMPSSLVTAAATAAVTKVGVGGGGGGGGVGRIAISSSATNLGTGTTVVTTPTFNNNGLMNDQGTLYVRAVNNSGADLAENYTTGDNTLEAGDVVQLSPLSVTDVNTGEQVVTKGVLRKAAGQYDRMAIGIISTDPGVLLASPNSTNSGDQRMLALTGKVPIKVSTENGPIHIGDFLTASSKPGIAMRATKAGTVVAQAMENDTDENPDQVEKITGFVKASYYNGVSTQDFVTALAPDVTTASDTTPSKSLLTALITQQQLDVKNTDKVNVSEILTDRLAASIEVVAPRIVTQDVFANGTIRITGADGTVNTSLDNQGNATFSGTLYANIIHANEIDGLNIYTDQLSSLTNRLNHLASSSAGLSTQSANIVLNPSPTPTPGTGNIFTSLAQFLSDVIYKGNVQFFGRATFNSDSAGYALIKQGADQVQITFSTPYDTPPVVVASPDKNVQYAITSVDVKQFLIQLNQVASQDVRFSWTATAVNGAKTFESTVSGALVTPPPSLLPTPNPTANPSTTGGASSSAIPAVTPVASGAGSLTSP